MDEEEILRSLDDENEENEESITCNTNRSEMDKNFLISVSVEGISSFLSKMEKIQNVEKDERKLVRLLLVATKNSGLVKSSETEKDLQKREMKLEKKFTEMRCSGIHYVNVGKVWHQVCSAQAAYNIPVRKDILQLILQHFWVSDFKLNKSHSAWQDVNNI